ncbi:MAG: class I SAM-dependent methyltransferase [Candidatus Accumulibacter sp.]|uniref:Class I SAM-dependent methyltransferase n=1 Tax=Candidatus Accumulibacter proximus TaxID=2954385 RepID=A0A935PX54_9PROT|nr:class I SAM-dependent methyltransferase [Candidatus Accumulibacter proximus]
MTFPTFVCQNCGGPLAYKAEVPDRPWCCFACPSTYLGNAHLIDYLGANGTQTSDHYSHQWGDGLGFLDFIKKRPAVKSVMPSARLGWDDLFGRIRDRAIRENVSVYDAACGFGGLANELINEQTANYLQYVGADIHRSLDTIRDELPDFDRCGSLVRWDISNPLPIAEKFEYVLCRASLHHTPDPAKSFASLCAMVKPQGTVAISVYNKKSICREASDDALRSVVSRMPVDSAFEVCRQFSDLGKALQKIEEKVVIASDLPLLGISRGEYHVQELIYYYFLKCFYNDEFGDRYSTLVNFDWYHPGFAYRYSPEEIECWFRDNDIEILKRMTIDVQHYFEGIKRHE